MSRSNPRGGGGSPVTRWFEWDSDNGTFSYWDADKKERIPVGVGFSCWLLDELACITGWSEELKARLWSNEVHSTSVEQIFVQAGKTGQRVAEGLYRDLKLPIKSMGGRFTTSLYVAYWTDEDPDLKLGNVRLKGAGLKAWLDFKKEHPKAYDEPFTVVSVVDKKTGRVKYKVPVFGTTGSYNYDEDNATAVEMDKALQLYFAERKAAKLARTNPSASTPAEVQKIAASLSGPAFEEPTADDDDEPDNEPVGEPITDDDIPF